MAATLPLRKSVKEIQYNYSSSELNEFKLPQTHSLTDPSVDKLNLFPSPSPPWLKCCTFTTASLFNLIQSHLDLVKVHLIIFIHLILILLIALIIVLCCLIQVAQECLEELLSQNVLAIKLHHWIKRWISSAKTVNNINKSTSHSNSNTSNNRNSNHPLIVAVIINATSRREAINNVISCLGLKVRQTVSYSLLAREPFIYQEYLPRYLAFFANCQNSTTESSESTDGPDIEVIKISNFSSKNTCKNISNVSSYLVAFKCKESSEMKNIITQLGYKISTGCTGSGSNLRLVNSSDGNVFVDSSNNSCNCMSLFSPVKLSTDLSTSLPSLPSSPMSMSTVSMAAMERTKNKFTSGYLSKNSDADTVIKVFSWLKRLFELMETAHVTFATLAKELTRHLYANWNRKPSSTTDLFTDHELDDHNHDNHSNSHNRHHQTQQVQYFNCNRLGCGDGALQQFNHPARSHQLTCKSLTLAIADCLPADLMSLIRAASSWTNDEIVITLIAAAIKSYVQVVTGQSPSNVEAFVDSPQMAHILLPLESADDLLATGSLICLQLRSQSTGKQLKNCKQLPNFLSSCIYKLCKSNNPIVFTSSQLDASCSNVLMSRSFYSWSQMQDDNCLRFDIIHSIDSTVICISARKDVVQSASLLAECIAKSLLNLCISLSISYDRRTPPSSPQDTTRDIR